MSVHEIHQDDLDMVSGGMLRLEDRHVSYSLGALALLEFGLGVAASASGVFVGAAPVFFAAAAVDTAAYIAASAAGM